MKLKDILNKLKYLDLEEPNEICNLDHTAFAKWHKGSKRACLSVYDEKNSNLFINDLNSEESITILNPSISEIYIEIKGIYL